MKTERSFNLWCTFKKGKEQLTWRKYTLFLYTLVSMVICVNIYLLIIWLQHCLESNTLITGCTTLDKHLGNKLFQTRLNIEGYFCLLLYLYNVVVVLAKSSVCLPELIQLHYTNLYNRHKHYDDTSNQTKYTRYTLIYSIWDRNKHQIIYCFY